ncbi:MAG: lamin tail domain-containing protein [Myxococcales bacterium]|nr:lamin tail domain-containing protein [Myxococcales bacterium]MCB9643823.1 lamin tail domain-containing protein [Myxococcales bacterium]
MSRWQSSMLSLFGLVGMFLWVGYGTGCGTTCRTALDCQKGQVCLDGQCKADSKPDGSESSNPDLPAVEQRPDGETTQPDGTPDGVKPETGPDLPAADKPTKGDLFINEILFDPPVDEKAGDANKDGKRDSSQDDFIEIVNNTDKTLDITGVVIQVSNTTVFTAPAARLPARTALVVFGGGMANDNEVGTGKGHSKFGGALVYTASLGLVTTSRTIVVSNAAGEELDTFAYGQGGCPDGSTLDQSVTRSPEDPTGTCGKHSELSSTGALFSPGTRADGSLFKDPPAEKPSEMTDGGEPTTEQPPLPKPVAGDLVINEVLYDPASDASGDANKDGTSSSSQDEFVEIVNSTSQKLDLSGVVLTVGGADKFTFPAGTALDGRGAIVVFGGGMTGDTEVGTGMPHSNFGGALVYTASLVLTNSGTVITLKDAGGTELAKFEYGGTACNPGSDVNQSVTLFPELTTGSCSKHSDVSGGTLFSPGTRVDGRPFSAPDPEPMPEASPEMTPDGGAETTPEVSPEPMPEPTPEPTGATPGVGDLIINEVLADPPAGADVNKDGTANTIQDEFVEIVNVSSNTLDLSGLKVNVGGATKHTFPSGLSLPAGKAIVVFAGGMTADTQVNTGMPHTGFGNALVYTSNISLVLTNGGTTVSLQTAAGVDVDTFTYGNTAPCKGDGDQSVNRSPDKTAGTCEQHSTISGAVGAYSPGTTTSGASF